MPARPLRYSPAAHLVLEHCLASPSRWFHGYTLLKELELPSGTLYPVLMRLAEIGWMETRWDSTRTGRPPRHLYRLSPGVRTEVRALLHQWRERGLAAPAPRHAT